MDKTTVLNWERNRCTPALWNIPSIIHFLGYIPFDSDQSLADRLRTYRKIHGLSQKKLANTLAIDPSTLAGWELGKSEPRGELLNRITGVLATHYTESDATTP